MIMNMINSPSTTKPTIDQIPNSLSSGPGGSGGLKGSTEISSSEVMLGVRPIFPFARLKDPVNYLIKLCPNAIYIVFG